MRIILFISISFVFLYSQSIDQLIQHALKKHPSLQSIKHKLSKMDAAIAISQNFKNPDVSLTLNDIHFSDPLSRTLEPMQYQAINIKQSLPWFGKLDAQKNLAQSQKYLVLNSYDAAKITLAREIRTTAYTLKELQKRITILDKYRAVAQQNIDLYTSYASTENKSHISSMSSSLLLSKIKIRHQKYLAILKIQKAKLHYLVQSKVSTISNQLQIKKPKKLSYYLQRAKHNPNYQMKRTQEQVAHNNITLKNVALQPDPYVKVGYFNRQGLDDFASITVGVSIPLYGTEEHTLEAARTELLSASSDSLDFKSSLYSEIEINYANLTEAYMIYNIITNESLPQLKHMFELTQSNIQNGADLFAYTNLLEQKLALEEQRITIVSSYLKTEAKLKSLIGEL